MFTAFLKKYVENEGKGNAEAKKCLELINKNKLCDQEIISILSYSLSKNPERNSVELINAYCLEGKGTIKALPTSIQIDGVDVKEGDVSSQYYSAQEDIAKRAKTLKSLFDMGKTKCCLSNCKKNSVICYLKIKIDAKNHKPTCVFCYECFKFIAVAYLNAFIKEKKSHILWKCICGAIIPSYYLQIALGRLLSDYYAIASKSETQTMFCVDCGLPTKTMKPGQTTGSIKCDKHSTK